MKKKAITIILSVAFIVLLCFATACTEPQDVAQNEIMPNMASTIPEETSGTAPPVMTGSAPQDNMSNVPSVPSSPAAQDNPQVTMLFTGDIMTHQSQIGNHYFNGQYDYSGDYAYIKDIVSKADIALANFEMTLPGKRPYTGFPRFRVPDAIADALYGAGFDIMATANNHIRDGGDDAFFRTNQVLRDKGFTVIGTKQESSGTKYAVIEKNGIKIGFINFTFNVNTGITRRIAPCINSDRTKSFSKSMNAIASEIDEVKKEGAEFIILVIHWGTQYQIKSNATQERIARKVSDMGVDLIIGGHPHVPQNVGEYQSPVSGKKTLIFYSLGNTIANMGYGFGPGHGYTETGTLALVKLRRQQDGGVAIDDSGYITTYLNKSMCTYKYDDAKGRARTIKYRAYDIVPAALAIQNPNNYRGITKASLRYFHDGLSNAQNTLGKYADNLKSFKFQEYSDYPW